MLRRNQALLSRLYILLDALAAGLAFLVGWYLRFETSLLPQFSHISFYSYMAVVPEAIVAFIVASGLLGLYGTTRSSRLKTIAIAQSKAVIGMIIVVIVLLNIEKQMNYSHTVILSALLLTWVFSFSGRMITRLLLRVARINGLNRKYILFVGNTFATKKLVNQLKQHEEMGYYALGYLSTTDECSEDNELKCLGHYHELDKILEQHIIDHLIFTIPNDDAVLLSSLITTAESHGIHAILVPNFIEILPSRPRFDEFAGIPIVDTRYTPLDDALNSVIKRSFDLLFAILVLLLASPLMIIIALIIKITSKGPVIYKQQRLGRNRRVFSMYKFRTMLCELEQDQPGWTVKDDPRKTKFGSFLRKTSLDELPQFINVLLGQMSVIGPRPEQPYFVDQFRDDIPRYMIKHRVRPGITGWAQVNGLRGDTSIEERIRYDLHYIEHWTFSWDMRIVALTLWKGFRNHNAY